MLLTLPELPTCVVEAANEKQRDEEHTSRARRERCNYSSILACQAYGPLRRMFIDHEHSRNGSNRFPLYQRHLKCRDATREVDAGAILAAFHVSVDKDTELLDDVPLDVADIVWSAKKAQTVAQLD